MKYGKHTYGFSETKRFGVIYALIPIELTHSIHIGQWWIQFAVFPSDSQFQHRPANRPGRKTTHKSKLFRISTGNGTNDNHNISQYHTQSCALQFPNVIFCPLPPPCDYNYRPTVCKCVTTFDHIFPTAFLYYRFSIRINYHNKMQTKKWGGKEYTQKLIRVQCALWLMDKNNTYLFDGKIKWADIR